MKAPSGQSALKARLRHHVIGLGRRDDEAYIKIRLYGKRDS